MVEAYSNHTFILLEEESMYQSPSPKLYTNRERVGNLFTCKKLVKETKLKAVHGTEIEITGVI